MVIWQCKKLDSDVKISAIPNGLEKYTAFTINIDLVFIDSMQFMKFSLNVFVKDLSDNFCP